MAGVAPIISIVPEGSLIVPSLRTDGSFKSYKWKTIGDITSDQKLHIVAQVPPAVPSGTFKFHIGVCANASANAALVDVAWNTVVDGDPGGSMNPTLNAEGDSTFTWVAGDQTGPKRKTKDITLDAGTAPTANDLVHLLVTFKSASWTLAADGYWDFAVVWV